MKSKLSILGLVLILSTSVFSGCGNGPEIARSAKQRVAAPAVAGSDLADLVNGNSAFAFDLYQVLREDEENDNLFYSPYSISLALAMTYAGARGETE
ncbi:MAG: hypothetical protein ISS49_12910 [Anaerolineae bacterium]|nr:hypothetical protein [Anaerolineae bacterium]